MSRYHYSPYFQRILTRQDVYLTISLERRWFPSSQSDGHSPWIHTTLFFELTDMSFIHRVTPISSPTLPLHHMITPGLGTTTALGHLKRGGGSVSRKRHKEEKENMEDTKVNIINSCGLRRAVAGLVNSWCSAIKEERASSWALIKSFGSPRFPFNLCSPSSLLASHLPCRTIEPLACFFFTYSRQSYQLFISQWDPSLQTQSCPGPRRHASSVVR
ncbi:hypothetical protein J3F84DRAFT_200245 [Trichoderma pleuroticola]